MKKMNVDSSTRESLLQSLEHSKEATLSEFSLEAFSPKHQCLLRRSAKLYLAGGLMLLLLPVVIFLMVLWVQHEQEGPCVPKNGDVHITLTSCGPVEGIAQDGGYIYRGIPYAVSLRNESVKKYRWKPAAPVTHLDQCWNDVLRFNPNPSECFQLSSNGEVYGTDDCLTLDIYSPRHGYENPSHVVVVIAVPTLAGGWPSSEDYKDLATPTAKFAADRDVVYVVPRFRLGPVGFLPRLFINETEFNPNITDFQEEQIKARVEREALEHSYNLAVSDLVAVLQWVQLNIENFGGETRSVTLLGWAGGATLVSSLTTLSNLPGYPFLFTQAWTIGGSGYPLVGPGLEHPDYRAGFTLWENSPCNKGKYDPKCLFGLTTEELFKSVPKSWVDNNLPGNHQWLRPDSYWLPNSVEEAWAQHRITHDIPLVIGTGLLEVLQFPRSGSLNVSDLLSYAEEIQSNIPSSANVSIANSTLLTQFMSDIKFTCPLRNLARNASRHFKSGVYFYVSDSSNSNQTGFKTSVGLNDLAAILGNREDSDALRNIQKLFFDFLHEAALPKNTHATDGIYLVSDDIVTVSVYSFCHLRELDHVWKKFAQLY